MKFKESFARFDYWVTIIVYWVIAGIFILSVLALVVFSTDLFIKSVSLVSSVIIIFFFDWLFKYIKRFAFHKSKVLTGFDLRKLHNNTEEK